MSLKPKKRHKRSRIKFWADNQKKHAMDRFKTRFDGTLSDRDYYLLVLKIQSSKSQCIQQLSRTLKNHIVSLRGMPIVAGYCTTTHHITTVFPVEWLGLRGEVYAA